MEIFYTGERNSMCLGKLTVVIDGERWVFPGYPLASGGDISIDADGNYEVHTGPWTIVTWPENFPDKKKLEVLERVNEEVPWGCCGGCTP